MDNVVHTLCQSFISLGSARSRKRINRCNLKAVSILSSNTVLIVSDIEGTCVRARIKQGDKNQSCGVSGIISRK